MADGYEHEFRWELSEPGSVIVTGSFDQWQSTVHLSRGSDGKFAATTRLPYGEKVLYKYIVDGHWTHNAMLACESDGNNNINNILHTPERPAVSEPAVATTSPIVATEEHTPVQSEAPISAATSSPVAAKAEENHHEAAAIGAGAGILGALSAGAAAFLATAETAITKAEAAIDHALEGKHPTEQAHLGEPLSGDLKAAAEGHSEPTHTATPLQNIGTLSTIVPGETPADPAPTPAPASSAESKALPTVPSTEQLSEKLGASDNKISVLPLVPEATTGEHPQALDTESSTTGNTFVPVVPEPPTTAPVDARTPLNRNASDALAPALAYYPSGADTDASAVKPETANSQVTTATPEVVSTSPAVAVVPTPAREAEETPAAATSTKKDDDASSKLATAEAKIKDTLTGNKSESKSDEKSAPSTNDPTAKAVIDEPALINGTSNPDNPITTTPAVPIETTVAANKKDKYGSIGKSGPAPVGPTVTPSTPTKSGVNSAQTTPTKGYVTAPTTPATPADRKRKSSFFQKIKNSLSPGHKRESTA